VHSQLLTLTAEADDNNNNNNNNRGGARTKNVFMKLKKTASKIFKLVGTSIENVADLLKALLQNDFWKLNIHTIM